LKIDQFKSFEKSFEISPEYMNGNLDIVSISSVGAPRDKTICFVKNMRLLTNLLVNMSDDGVCLGIIFEKEFFEKEKEKIFNEINQVKEILFYSTVDNVDLAMSKLSKPFYDEINEHLNDLVDGRQMGTTDIHPTAWIAQGVFIGENVQIAANVKIYSGCVVMSQSCIGEGTVLFPNVTIYRQVTIGKSCRIHSGCVIGTDGFGYNYDGNQHLKVWHLGRVIINDNVELGAGNCIDRGTFDDTVIEEGCRFDNMVHIAHNCHIGKKVLFCGQSGVAGSTKIGARTAISGNVGIAPNIEIGEDCQIGGNAGVTSNLSSGSVVSGYPARPLREWLRSNAVLRKLSLNNKKDSNL